MIPVESERKREGKRERERGCREGQPGSHPREESHSKALTSSRCRAQRERERGRERERERGRERERKKESVCERADILNKALLSSSALG